MSPLAKIMINYCVEDSHSPDSIKAVQDLVNQGLITWDYFSSDTCINLKQLHDYFRN